MTYVATAPHRESLGRALVAASVLALLASPAGAIEAPDLSISGPRDSTFRIKFSNRSRGEFVDWFRPPAAAPTPTNQYDFFGNKLQFGIGYTRERLEIFGQMQWSMLANLPEDGVGPGATYFANTPETFQSSVFLRQAWIKNAFDLPHGTLTVRAGRTRYMEGAETRPDDAGMRWLKSKRIAQRLIGPFDYTHIGRSFDGFMLAYDQSDINVTGFWDMPTSGGFEIDAGRSINQINIGGLAVTANPKNWDPTDARLFYFLYNDNRDVVRLDNRPLAVREADMEATTVHTIGANGAHIKPLGPGRADILGWTAGQFGNWQSQTHRAWAYDVEIGYQLPDVAWSPWLRGGFYRGSGDDNPGDDLHESFFQMLPTARLYALTPFYNMMNNQDLFVQLLLKPLEQLGLRTDFHYLRAVESRDFVYRGGGATSSTFFGYAGIPANGDREIGYLLDVGLTWTPLDFLKLYGYYGHVFGRKVLESNFAGADANYGFIDVTLSF